MILHEVSWIDVTKTQDDSWVATALSLNILMPLLLKPLENMINSHLSRGSGWIWLDLDIM